MDVPDQIQAIDNHTLTPLVRQLLHSDTAELTEWHCAPLGWDAYVAMTGGLYRFTGYARDNGGVRPWSLILKVVRAPAQDSVWRDDDPTRTHYWKREPLAYASGMLDDLPGSIVAPDCFGVVEQPGEAVWLWLEEVVDAGGEHWPLAPYGLAARHLGRFNGAYLTGHPLPDEPWLGRDGLRTFYGEWPAILPSPLELLQSGGMWEHPLVRRAFPTPGADSLLRFWDERLSFFDVVDQLPQTFCHGDADRVNLLIRWLPDGQEQTVAIDWAAPGIGNVGAEIAPLVFSSLLRIKVKATDTAQLDTLVFQSYLQGLREAGWQGDARLVWYGYTVPSVCWGLFGASLLRTALEQDDRKRIERYAGVVAFLSKRAETLWDLRASL